MYTTLKSAISQLIPRTILFRYEPIIRGIYALAYRGNKHQCNICKKELREFVDYGYDLICPNCGSSARGRRLWDILGSEFLTNSPRILHFSPSRSLYRAFKKKMYRYLSSDLSGDFIADVSYDLSGIDVADNSFDLIVCYHILEHIPNDTLAMQELIRILKPGGYCLVQTPFKEGETYEDFTITTPAERTEHFGQDDHVRIYSANGLKQRLVSVGFKVQLRTYSSSPGNKHGFKNLEYILVCQKN